MSARRGGLEDNGEPLMSLDVIVSLGNTQLGKITLRRPAYGAERRIFFSRKPLRPPATPKSYDIGSSQQCGEQFESGFYSDHVISGCKWFQNRKGGSWFNHP